MRWRRLSVRHVLRHQLGYGFVSAQRALRWVRSLSATTESAATRRPGESMARPTSDDATRGARPPPEERAGTAARTASRGLAGGISRSAARQGRPGDARVAGHREAAVATHQADLQGLSGYH